MDICLELKNVKSKGFTLLEILIVIAVIGIIMAITIPNFMGRKPAEERKNNIAELNSLLHFGWQNALEEQKIYKVKFDTKKNIFSLETTTGIQEKGKPTFKPVPTTYTETSFEWPENLEIRQFIIEGNNEFATGAKDAVWFFIMPDGLSQDIIINFIDSQDPLPDGKMRQIGLVLNPFTIQFKEYDSFQK